MQEGSWRCHQEEFWRTFTGLPTRAQIIHFNERLTPESGVSVTFLNSKSPKKTKKCPMEWDHFGLFPIKITSALQSSVFFLVERVDDTHWLIWIWNTGSR